MLVFGEKNKIATDKVAIIQIETKKTKDMKSKFQISFGFVTFKFTFDVKFHFFK